MKWGLVPFWTKRNPDYASVMKTINTRDDSLATKGGMWHTMKQSKRCIVVAQGFYEWLKKNGGKEKIPHFTKRKDEQLMCLAGLWDCVTYEGSDQKLKTYSIITTDSNKELSFLHDRMPVILENGSDEIRTWLDPGRSEWSKELQSLLKPYQGELECYPVRKEVGKVGNNSPSFIIPVASSENKHNIINFFKNAKKTAATEILMSERKVKNEEFEVLEKNILAEITKEEIKAEDQTANDYEGTEDRAALPASSIEPLKSGIKRELEAEADGGRYKKKLAKVEENWLRTKKVNLAPASGSLMPPTHKSPAKAIADKKTRSATSNCSAQGSLVKSSGTRPINTFFH